MTVNQIFTNLDKTGELLDWGNSNPFLEEVGTVLINGTKQTIIMSVRTKDPRYDSE